MPLSSDCKISWVSWLHSSNVLYKGALQSLVRQTLSMDVKTEAENGYWCPRQRLNLQACGFILPC